MADELMLNGFDLYRLWRADVSSRLGTSTVRQYRYYVFSFFADVGKHPLTVGQTDVERYLGELRPQYAVIIRAGLSDFFDFLIRRGLREANPLVGTRVRAKGGRRLKRGLSEEEMTRLVIAATWQAACRPTRWRIPWLIIAQYALGLRPGELVRLTPRNIHLDAPAPYVTVTHTKTGNDRIVPVGDLARRALEELLHPLAFRRRPPAGSIVGLGRTQYGAYVKEAAVLAGLDPAKCRAYALRHSFASRLVEKGTHIRVVAELLGHVDLRATMTYTVPSDEQLRRAVGEL